MFVIHVHRGYGADHYDLMIEQGQALATWRLADRPEDLPSGTAMPAEKLADHRSAYLEYEGPVSQGRGEVSRLDRGACDVCLCAPGLWLVCFHGERLRGPFQLEHVGPAAEQWNLTCLGAS